MILKEDKVKRKIKILFVPTGNSLAPATRYRVCEFLPFLEKEGISCQIYSIISKEITNQMIKSATFNKLQKLTYYIQVVAEKFMRSWKVIFLAGRFDAIFLQRTTFPLGLEKVLRIRNKNIIFDIDDAIYTPDKEESGIIGWFKKYTKKREVVSILKISKCVIVENNYLKNFVQRYCKKVHIITGPIDTVKNFAKQYRRNSDKLTIGWIGSPSTALYLKMIDNVLKELSRKYKIRVRLIGAGSYTIEGVDVEAVDWSEDTEVFELHKFDIGIMPMPDNEWTRGKVGCKMLQYMGNAIPSVVSWTPTTAEVIEDGINGFLSGSEEEWIKKLSLLIEKPYLREKIGFAGRKIVDEKFSVEVNAPRFLEILKNICNT